MRGNDVKEIMARFKKLLVRKANDLIEARSYLTAAERKAFAVAVAFTRRVEDNVYGVAEVDFDVLKKILEEERIEVDKHFRDRLRRVLRKLASKRELALVEIPIARYKEWLVENGKKDWLKKLGIEDVSEGTIYAGVIDDVIISDDKKKVKVRFNRFITPLILELRKRYTVYELKYVLLLEGQYAPTLYELLKKNEKLGVYKVSVEELKRLLGATSSGYKYWTQFYERVLQPALKEINQKTDLSVEMKFAKGQHGKVSEVTFFIKTKPSVLAKFKDVHPILNELSKMDKDLTPEELAYALLTLRRVNPSVAIWFLLHYPTDESRLYAWEHVKWADENPKINNPDRYLESLIKDKNKDLEWFLDQRTKDLIRNELSKIAKPLLEEAEKREEIERLFNEVISTYQFLPREGKVEILKTYGGKEKFQAFLKNLKENLDVEGLKEILKKLKEVAENHRDELDDLFWGED